MILSGKSGFLSKVTNLHIIKLLPVLLPALLQACASGYSAPAPLSAPQGELRTDVSQIDDAMALRMARRFENAGDLTSALNMYRRALQISPESTAALLGVARIYGQAGAQEEAVRYYKRILQLEPANSEAATAIAEEHIFKGEAREAISFISQFMLVAPGTATLFNALGIAHDLEGAHGDAQLAYAEGLNMSPNDPAITSNLALSFAVREDYQTAIALLERVLGDAAANDEAGRSVARQNLALVYALSGQLDAAEDIAKTVLSPQEVQINRSFYARLAGLSSSQKARAVFLGSLPSLLESTETEREAADDSPAVGSPVTEEQKAAAAARIARQQGFADQLELQADAETVAVPATAAGPDEYPPYWVQLGSYRSPERAKIGWNTLSAQYPVLLGGYIAYLKTYENEDKGQFFRLMVQASETRSAANLVCGSFKIVGLDCLAIKTGGNIRPLLEAD